MKKLTTIMLTILASSYHNNAAPVAPEVTRALITDLKTILAQCPQHTSVSSTLKAQHDLVETTQKARGETFPVNYLNRIQQAKNVFLGHETSTIFNEEEAWYARCLEEQKESLKETQELLENLEQQSNQEQQSLALFDAVDLMSRNFATSDDTISTCLNTLRYNTTPKPSFTKSMLPKSFLNPMLAPLFLVATKAYERISHTQLPLSRWIKFAAIAHLASSASYNYRSYQKEEKIYDRIKSEPRFKARRVNPKTGKLFRYVVD